MRKMSMAIPLMIAVFAVIPMQADAKENIIQSGIYANDMDLSGMTTQEARDKVQA